MFVPKMLQKKVKKKKIQWLLSSLKKVKPTFLLSVCPLVSNSSFSVWTNETGFLLIKNRRTTLWIRLKLVMWLVSVNHNQPESGKWDMNNSLWLLTQMNRNPGAQSQQKIIYFLIFFLLNLLLRMCRWLPTFFPMNPLNFLCNAGALNPSTKRLGWDPLASGDARKHLSPPNAAVHRGRKPFCFFFSCYDSVHIPPTIFSFFFCPSSGAVVYFRNVISCARRQTTD